MDIETEFQNAQETVKRLAFRPSNERLLKLYALYKQATAGDNDAEVPDISDLVSRAKHDAWAALKGKTQTEAMSEMSGTSASLSPAVACL